MSLLVFIYLVGVIVAIALGLYGLYCMFNAITLADLLLCLLFGLFSWITVAAIGIYALIWVSTDIIIFKKKFK